MWSQPTGPGRRLAGCGRERARLGRQSSAATRPDRPSSAASTVSVSRPGSAGQARRNCLTARLGKNVIVGPASSAQLGSWSRHGRPGQAGRSGRARQGCSPSCVLGRLVVWRGATGGGFDSPSRAEAS